MKNKVKIAKRLLSILLVFLFSINSIAAVSDNDGSAFITKAEFDALKSSFQSQIDTYNQNIDSKIDQAIASYLAGIKIDKEMSTNVIPNTWKEVVFMNYAIAPTFRLPEYDAIVSYTGYSECANNNRKQFALHGRFFYNFKWDASQGNTCYRPLFGYVNKPDGTATNNMYWRGIALRYHEKYIVGFAKHDKYDDLASMDVPGASVSTTFSKFFRLFINSTAHPDGKVDPSSTDFFNPTTQYWNTGANVDPSSTQFFNAKVETSVTLDDYNNKVYDYEHIISYKNNTSWCLSNEVLLTNFREHASNTNTDTTLYNKVDKTSYNSIYIGFYDGNENGWAHGQLVNPKFTNAGDKLASIGMLPSDTQANAIYQYDSETKKFKIEKTTFTLDNAELHKGLQLLAGLDKDEITWNASFSEVYCWNGISYATNANEVDIYMSYVPFSDDITSTDYIQFKDAGGSMQNHITTSSRNATLKWTQNKDSVIYIKCVPHFSGTAYFDKDWRVKLDLTGDSGSYIRKVAD